MKVNGNDYAVSIKEIEDNIATVAVNGVEYNVEIEGAAIKRVKTPKVVQVATVPSTDSHPSTARTAAPVATGEGRPIKSPLPGVILDVMVREGDTIKIGQQLMVLEAMKMENNIESDIEGVVKNIVKRKGDSVLEGDVLITIG